jgi:hypothetical protein
MENIYKKADGTPLKGISLTKIWDFEDFYSKITQACRIMRVENFESSYLNNLEKLDPKYVKDVREKHPNAILIFCLGKKNYKSIEFLCMDNGRVITTFTNWGSDEELEKEYEAQRIFVSIPVFIKFLIDFNEIETIQL